MTQTGQSNYEIWKVVFSDGRNDKAISGQLINEDDFFVFLKTPQRVYRVAKSNVKYMKQRTEEVDRDGGR